MKKLDLLITGVGGQGVILASNIISEAALAAGYDIKKTDTLGMAQRGGSVLSHVRIGRQVYSPLIKEGDVDIMLALEKLEAARWSHYLRVGAVAIVNNHTLPPPSVSLGNEQYPPDAEVTELLKRRSGYIYFINATSRARELGDARTFNVFLLGCISVFTPFRLDIWKKAIARCVPAKVEKLNYAAFDEGRKEIRGIRIRQGSM